MGQEIELKLEVPQTSISEAAEIPWLRDLVRGAVKCETLTSVYFDTPKCRLRDRGVSLRVRHIGDKRLQTVKVTRKGGNGAFGRDEWEEEIGTDAPDRRLARRTALAPLATKKLFRKVRPVFETVVERTTLPIGSGGNEVEVAVDCGYISAGRDREPISEIELELKSGTLAELVRIADRVADRLPGTAYGARAKQDRGYALAAGEVGDAVEAAAVALDRRSSSADAFRVIALACLDHALANERAVRARDAEGVHQMRVGLRRLRAALSLFKPLIDGIETEAVKTELEWLTGELAPARDFEVLLAKEVRRVRGDGPAAESEVLAKDLDEKRDQGFGRAIAALDDDRFRRLGLKIALWIIDGGWARDSDPAMAALRVRPAVEFVTEILGKRLKKLIGKARRIGRLDPRRRHKLRISVKKLRYGVAFFASLFDGAKTKAERERLSNRLKQMQDALGRLNDITVHGRIAHRVVQEPSANRAKKALAMGFVTGREQTEIAPCIAAVGKSAKRLARLSPFWE